MMKTSYLSCFLFQAFPLALLFALLLSASSAQLTGDVDVDRLKEEAELAAQQQANRKKSESLQFFVLYDFFFLSLAVCRNQQGICILALSPRRRRMEESAKT